MSLKEKIVELYNQGLSYNEIKETLGCSKSTICYHVGFGQKKKFGERQKNSRSKIRKYMQEYKSQRSCADCKEKYPYWIMEFDHLGNKKFTISAYRKTTSSLEEIKKEIEKCEVVCANCHKNRTFLRSLKTLNDVGTEFLKEFEE
jgi:transposase